MTYGLNGNGLVLMPRRLFLESLQKHIDPRKLRPIEPYVFSIDHKLNVARYNAGLIQSLHPRDYDKHYLKKDYKVKASRIRTKVEYSKRCVYYAYDWDQYALGALTFVESFAAAAFSLFDSSGYLLKEMYNLPISPEAVNFFEATEKIKGGNPHMYSFLANYRLDDLACHPWFKTLKELRNHTTHAQVTDILKLETPMPPHSQEIRLNGKSIKAKDDPILREFVEECFLGLEEYVDQLYLNLARQVEE